MRNKTENQYRVTLSFWGLVPKSLNLLAALALVSLTIKILILNQIPSKFVGAQQLGTVTEGVLASVCAIYVFYLMVVHRKEVDDLRAVHPFVKRQAQSIAGRYKAMILEFGNASQVDLHFDTFTEQDLSTALEKINPNDNAPLIIGQNLEHAKWFQYPLENISATEERIERIYKHVKYIDARVIYVLSEIGDSHYMHFVKLVNSNTQIMRNKDMTVFAKAIFQHAELCRKLDGFFED